jgi:NADH dehydrogenase FAD-containing subunit
MGLHANVTIVESHMVALDAQQQVLMLADGGQLPYDLLAVTTGLQVSRPRDQISHLSFCCRPKKGT